MQIGFNVYVSTRQIRRRNHFLVSFLQDHRIRNAQYIMYHKWGRNHRLIVKQKDISLFTDLIRGMIAGTTPFCRSPT